jgi:hypothetical protein
MPILVSGRNKEEMKNFSGKTLSIKRSDLLVIILFLGGVSCFIVYDKSLERIYGFAFWFSVVLLLFNFYKSNKISKWIIDIAKAFIIILLILGSVGLIIRFFS